MRTIATLGVRMTDEPNLHLLRCGTACQPRSTQCHPTSVSFPPRSQRAHISPLISNLPYHYHFLFTPEALFAEAAAGAAIQALGTTVFLAHTSPGFPRYFVHKLVSFNSNTTGTVTVWKKIKR